MKKNAPSFPIKPDGLYNKLQQGVKAYFESKHKQMYGDWKLHGKAIVVTLMMIASYVGLLLVPTAWYTVLPMYMLLGFTYALIGFNITHDANHGSFFANRKLNSILGYSLNFIGGDKVDRHRGHNQAHHTYTNIQEHDHDIEYFGLMRLSPHQEHKWFHKYQYLYCFALYAVSSFYWFGVEWLPFNFKRLADPLHAKKSIKEQSIFYTIKAIYFSMLLVIPITIHGWLLPLIGYLLFHVALGITIFTVFQLAHIVDETEFPLPTNSTPNMKDEWALHQLKTTVNFGTGKRILTWIVGGLNFQVEHHLFPKIAHTHYPAISKIVKRICQEEHIPYREYKNFADALKAHLHHLYLMGQEKILSTKSQAH